MDDISLLQPAWLPLCLVLALFLSMGVWGWIARRASAAARLRAAGYRLIAALQAYSAWVELQRDEPLEGRTPEELSLPEPLRLALSIKESSFPQLAPAMVQLLLSHSRLMEMLWRRQLLRLSGAAPPPVYRDPRYLSLRDWQERILEQLITGCRQQIGEDQPWRPTGSDFAFSSGFVH
ncbi:hypothetical protein [Ramlibacter sp.]|uniref:hypothetical protein n=1 Tax=Ramlibacter sp. TaxID=1917967 RepID=UPI001832C20F|nr:hypothetical protein [Ramlibacter sp.]MBA2672515.1 hypothetical protein [Ramlibacter sp.]